MLSSEHVAVVSPVQYKQVKPWEMLLLENPGPVKKGRKAILGDLPSSREDNKEHVL